MRVEKKALVESYAGWLQSAPFFILVNYHRMDVAAMTELRKRLRKVGAELHVVKNSLFKRALAQVGIDPKQELVGQLAVVFGRKDVCAAAKVVKTFAAEFERPSFVFGCLGNELLSADQIKRLAELPALEELRAGLLRILMAPATNLVRVLNAPASQMVRVLQAKVEKGQ